MQSQEQRHILVIPGVVGKQPIALDAAAYSIGRDRTNAIVLDFDTVSRQHAILLRVPEPETNSYRYCLVDGNAAGRPSSNGIFVNGERCSNHYLSNGDVITFGRKIQAFYLTVSMAETELSEYLHSIQFQSIKTQQVSHKATLVGAELPSREPATVIAAAKPAAMEGRAGDDHPALAASNVADVSDVNASDNNAADALVSAGRVPTQIETLHEGSSHGQFPLSLSHLGLAMATLSLLGVMGLGWLQFSNTSRPATPTAPASGQTLPR